ncbi:thioredoxin domain-containing protein 12 [Plakobranchus ocellatus]|uniref:Thioredoxin domain-containing protein 12 n=1 Tax=Plakobranchus ocellatus TaxID=259542 RepID=A0AAV3YVD9_9GAST|nr:thioredoxin domain-containing protein 12 [Plakobranchus ocellatus]
MIYLGQFVKTATFPHPFPEWTDSIGWIPLEEAKKSGKPALVLIYNPNCSMCCNLKAKLMAHPGVKMLSPEFAMVHLTADEIPTEEKGVFTPDGAYVPRILFFDANFNFLPQVQGTEPTYQYFYRDPRAIEISMRRVLYMHKYSF